MLGVRYQTMILCEEEKKGKEIKNVQPKVTLQFNHCSYQKRIVISKSDLDFRELSFPARQLVKKTYSKIQNMKESTNHIKELNSLYLTKKAQKSLPKITSSSNLNNEYHNFVYVTDNYRKHLNKAFMKYNPLIHLENLKFLEKADPEIQNDIVQLKEMIDNDLVEITDKHYYKKRYEEYVRKKKSHIHLLNQEVKSRNKRRLTTAGTNNTRNQSIHFVSSRKKTTVTEQKRLINQKKETCKHHPYFI